MARYDSRIMGGLICTYHVTWQCSNAREFGNIAATQVCWSEGGNVKIAARVESTVDACTATARYISRYLNDVQVNQVGNLF